MFIRDYTINIFSPQGDLITINKPFTVKFSITRNTLASANNCNLVVHNLGASTRSKLYKDRYTITEYWQITISAGYENIEGVFQGNILECYSYKQGTEWITEIKAFDGMYGIQNGFTSKTFNKNTPKKNIIQSVIKDMPNILQGVLGTPTQGQSNPRGQVLLGQSSDVLNKETGGQYFIDNETINVVEDKEYIGTTILQLDSKILLSTPKRRDTFLDCEMLFYPSATVGSLVNLISLVPEYIGNYKIMGFKHDVEISGSIAGNAKTMLSLYTGANALKRATG